MNSVNNPVTISFIRKLVYYLSVFIKAPNYVSEGWGSGVFHR